MLRGSPWHRHRHHPRGSSRPAPAPCPDTPGTALRPQSLPPVAPDSLGSCTLTCCTRGPMRPPEVPCSPSWLREDPGSVPRAPGQGEASRPRGHCHSLPGASCGHCPAPAAPHRLCAFSIPGGEHRTAGNTARSPAAHQRPQSTAPRRDGHSRLEKQRRTSWDGELGHKVQSRTKTRNPVRGDPRAQPAPSGPRGGSHSRGWPRSSPRGCRPPPPPQPGAAPECK